MRLSISKAIIPAFFLSLVVIVVALTRPVPTAALPDYATKTGQACGVCHVNPAGGGARTAVGQRFEAIPTHAANPGAAFTQAQAAAQPTATTAPAKPAATPTAAPAATATASPAKPAATATQAPTPGALPRTGGLPVVPLVVSGASILVILGWLVRSSIRR